MARSDAKHQKDETTIIGGSRSVPLPKNMIDAVSQIQQYYTLEKEGTAIPADFLTLEGTLDLWGIGFKTSVKNGLFSALISLFMIGVFYKYIPIFGNFNPSLYDKIWAVITNYSLTICHALFLSYVTRYYIGDITKTAIKNLFYGIILGSFIITTVIFVFYHTLYYLVLTDKNVASVLLSIKGLINFTTLERIYYWIMDFKRTFIVASWAVFFNMIFILSVPLFFMLFKAKRVNTEIKNRDKWQIGV